MRECKFTDRLNTRLPTPLPSPVRFHFEVSVNRKRHLSLSCTPVAVGVSYIYRNVSTWLHPLWFCLASGGKPVSLLSVGGLSQLLHLLFPPQDFFGWTLKGDLTVIPYLEVFVVVLPLSACRTHSDQFGLPRNPGNLCSDILNSFYTLITV